MSAQAAHAPCPDRDESQTDCCTPDVTDSLRPRLLLTAARHGLALYRRDRDLPRLLTLADARLRPLDALRLSENRHEAARRGNSATYSYARHIDVLIAVLAEMRLSPRG